MCISHQSLTRLRRTQWRVKIGVTAIEALGVGIGFFKTSTPIPIATPTPMDSGLGYFLTSFRSEAAYTGVALGASRQVLKFIHLAMIVRSQGWLLLEVSLSMP